MMKTIKIARDEQGQYSVGEEAQAAPPNGMPSPEGAAGTTAPTASTMKPVGSLEEALAQAKQMLEEPSDATGEGDPFEGGFKGVRGNNPPTGY